MGIRLTSKFEIKDYLGIIIVTLVTLVIPVYIQYGTVAKEYRQIIATKELGTLAFIRNLESLLRNKFTLQNESTYKPEPTTYMRSTCGRSCFVLYRHPGRIC